MKAIKKPKMLIAILIGLAVSLLTVFVCLCVASIMILNNSLSVSREGFVVVGAHVLASLLGVAVSCALCDQPLISCGCVVGSLLLLEIATTILAYSGEFQNVLGYVVGDIAGGLLGMFLMTFTKNKKGRRIQKYRPR